MDDEEDFDPDEFEANMEFLWDQDPEDEINSYIPKEQGGSYGYNEGPDYDDWS